MRKLIFMAFLLALFAAPASAQVDGCNSQLRMTCSSMRLSICPAGDFEEIKDACVGVIVPGHIEMIVRDAANNPIPGIPVTDYWLDACDQMQSLCQCVPPIFADMVTDFNGRTTFSGTMHAGGCILTDGIWMACQGVIILRQPACIEPVCLDVVIVSPDITADCVVDASDLSYFGSAYNTCVGHPRYNPCCDYTDDGCVNLSDFSYFAEHYLHRC
jgi:hypothetical protein